MQTLSNLSFLANLSHAQMFCRLKNINAVLAVPTQDLGKIPSAIVLRPGCTTLFFFCTQFELVVHAWDTLKHSDSSS